MPDYREQTDNPITDYSETLGKTENYMYSVQHAKDLHLASLPAQTEPEISYDVNQFGIGTLQMQENDVPSINDSENDRYLGTSPNITEESLQGQEDKSGVLASIYNAAPEWMQKAATPFLVPFTDNPVMRGVTIGIPDAINGTLSVLRDINNAMHPDHQFSEEEWLKIPDIIERGDSTTEAVVSGLTQFLSVYSSLGKFSNVSKLSSKGAKLWDDMWRAGLADAAFDPEDGNLSTFISMLDEETNAFGIPIGKMNGAFTQWLGTPVGEDAEAWERLEGRARNLIEGAGLGMLANGFIAALRGLKQYMVETNPDKYFAMLKKAGFDVDPRQFLFENTLGAENVQTPKLNELGMYSQLEKAMINMTQDKNKPEDLLRYLTKNGVSNDELTNSGVIDLINEKKAAGESITKDEVMEIFTDSDVTQSYQAITRTYQEPSQMDSLTDEDELLEIYNAGGDASLSRYDNVNGKVLDYDEVDADIEFAREEIMRKFDEDTYDPNDSINLLEKMQDLYPETYPKGLENSPDALDDFYEQLSNVSENDDVFRQHVEEATRAMAEANYDADPIFRWNLNKGNYEYQITGNKQNGYQTTVFREGSNVTDTLDVAYTLNETMVQVQGHQNNFGNNLISPNSTKWEKVGDDWNIVHKDAVNTYEETVITADSPSGTYFKGGKAHFPEDNKVFHLRTTEPDADTLFIEEIQSDWANEISKKGVKKGDEYNSSTRRALQDAVAERNAFLETTDWEFSSEPLIGVTSPIRYDSEQLVPRNKGITDRDADAGWDNESPKIKEKIIAFNKIIDDLKAKVKEEANAAPQSPLPNDKWINAAFRTALAKAIDAGKTRVEWTPAQVHIDRWDEQYAKMYKILYDEKMGGIAKKISNKYNSNSGQYYLEISPEMIAHHKSGKGEKLMAAAPAIPAAEIANEEEDS